MNSTVFSRNIPQKPLAIPFSSYIIHFVIYYMNNIMTTGGVISLRLWISIVLFIAAAVFSWQQSIHIPESNFTPVNASINANSSILLLPLDGRPPCRKAVMDIGAIAGTKVDIPPSELMDYYSKPGDTKGLRQWVMDNANGHSAIILSADQLIYGGLLAAREGSKEDRNTDDAEAFLRQLHQRYPHIPIYVFSILPRITPPDSIDGYYDKKYILRYSRLMGRWYKLGDPDDYEEAQVFKEKINPDSLLSYESVFRNSTKINDMLINLAHEGILHELVLGQDDGEEYSIPNIEKEKLRSHISLVGAKNVKITHGADEIAMLLVAEITSGHQKPKVYVDWNDRSTPDIVMPYMAISMEKTIDDKLSLIGAMRTASPDDADFILFVSCGSTESMDSRLRSVRRIKSYMDHRYKIALVDLSKHFTAEETLMPLMIKENVPLHSMIAYSGWNTASNSVGTALAQAVTMTAAENTVRSKAEAAALWQRNIKFLDGRFMEDYFYLKDVISLIDITLKKSGYTNVYDLDLEHNYIWCTAMLRKAMSDRLYSFKHTRSFLQPIKIDTPDGAALMRVKSLDIDTSFPWPRTFEIYMDAMPYVETSH